MFNKKISNIQKKLLIDLKKKILNFNNLFFKYDKDLPVYYSSYYNSSGLEYVKKKLGYRSSYFQNFKNIFKDFFYSMNYLNLELKNHQKILSEKVIVTWGFKNSFKINGSLEDKYFNINSRNSKKISWVVLYLDKILPKKIDNNIILIKTKNLKFDYRLFLLFKFFLINLKYLILNLHYFLFSISSHNFFSFQLLKIFSPLVTKKIKYILMPYEAQPFQNRLVKFFNEKKIKTIGYIHSPPQALPINFIKKKYSPKKIYLNGQDQKKCFIKLGWSKNDLKVIKSNRFLNKKRDFSKTIFLPISIKSPRSIINSLMSLIEKYNLDIRNYKIANHPAATESYIHKKLIKEILHLKNTYKNKLNSNNSKFRNFSIFIGATGAIVEALERGFKVIHITEYPNLDTYSEYFWNNIRSKSLKKNLNLYTLKKRSHSIMFGSKPKNLDIYFQDKIN